MGLRLPAGEVTVLLGPIAVRRHFMCELDDASGRGSDGDRAAVIRVRADRDDSVGTRVRALDAARDAALVVVDGLTDGLSAPERRAVLTAVRAVAASGSAVLVDDTDPVAALAVADAAVRADSDGTLEIERVGDPDYLAS